MRDRLLVVFKAGPDMTTLLNSPVKMADYRVTWDKKKEHELVDFFEAHPCLWDHTHIDYFRRDVRDALMKDLSNKLGYDRSGKIYTEIHIKRRWKNLRTTYARECRKSENKSDTNPDNQYVSKWAFIDRLGFVKDFIKARIPNNYSSFNSNLSSSTTDQSENFQTLSDDDIDKEDDDEEEDDDLVVCLSESFKENHSTQKSNPNVWESDNKNNQALWIAETASLLNSQSDVKNVDNGKATAVDTGETTWIVQEKTGSRAEWRLEDQRGNSLEMWKKGFRPVGQEQFGHIEITENKHDSENSVNSIGHVTYIRDLKGECSETASPNHDYQRGTEVISIGDSYNNERVSWNKDKENELISFFESNRFLWDHLHPDYFNRDLRDCLVKELSSKLGKDQHGQPYSETFIKQKWKNLRTTYARELKKMERHKIHYHEAPYISRWTHTERLSFLKDCLKVRGQSRNMSHLQNNVDPCQTYSLSDDSDGDNESVTWSSEPFPNEILISEPISLRNNNNSSSSSNNKIENDNATRSSETYTDANYSNSPQYATGGIKKRRYLEDLDPKEDLFKEALKMLNLRTRHDPEDLFGMHVAGSLRRMQPLQREKAKLDIQSILLQYCFSETN